MPNEIITAGVGVYFGGHHNISYIEATDISGDGTGGIPELTSGGLNTQEFFISFTSSLLGGGIHFQTAIYGIAPPGYNDFRIGRFEARNVVLLEYVKQLLLLTIYTNFLIKCFFFEHSERLYIQAVANATVNGTLTYTGGSRVITMIQGLADNENGNTGSLISVGGGIGSTNTTLIFESLVGGNIDFYIYIFGA